MRDPEVDQLEPNRGGMTDMNIPFPLYSPGAETIARKRLNPSEANSTHQVVSSTPATTIPPLTGPTLVDRAKWHPHPLLEPKQSNEERSRELLYVGQTTSPEPLTDRDSGASLRCTWPGCTYEGTFRRKYERDRHVAHKHDHRNYFACPAVSCFGSQQKTTFRRADKLTLHLRNSHNPTMVFDCVEPDCTIRLEGNPMFVHLQRHVLSSPSEVGMTTKAVMNGLSPAFRRCPVSNCAANVPLDQLPVHLLRHHSTQLPFMHQDLLEINYVCIYRPVHERENPHHGEDPWSVTCIYVACPVCGWQNQNHQSFYAHLVASHVLKDDAHFQSWRSDVNDALVQSGYEWISSAPDLDAAWKPWRLALLSADNINMNICCRVCNVVETIISGGPIKHHLSILAPFEQLLLYRYKILGLYPEFGSHPVFEDIYLGQFDIIQVFRLKRMAQKVLGGIECDPVPRNYINTHTPIPQDVSYLDESMFNSYDMALVNEQVLHDLELLPEDFDSSMLSHLGCQFHTSSTIDWQYEGSEPYQIRDYLSHDNSSLTSEVGAWSMLQHNSDNISVPPTQSSLTAPSTSHQSSSTGKRYSCDHPNCTRAFERRSELDHHRRWHISHEMRPHVCPRCPKRFLESKDLQRHLKTHSNFEPDHICPTEGCGKAFKRKDGLTRHINTVHGQRSTRIGQ